MDVRLSQTQTLAVSEHANNTGRYALWDEVIYSLLTKTLPCTLVELKRLFA